MDKKNPIVFTLFCLALIGIAASELYLDGKILAASKSPLVFVKITLHGLLLILTALTLIRKNWARKFLVALCVIQALSLCVGLYSLRTPKSHLGRATFTGYVRGYQEGLKAKGADVAALQLTEEKLNQLWANFEKTDWPKAQKPLLGVMLLYLAFYLAVVICLTRPRTRELFAVS